MFRLFKKKTKVILDTNFLFIPGDVGVDVFSKIFPGPRGKNRLIG